jgi:hypothetical protein
MTEADVRRLALALPESVEQDHHGFPSYRVGGKIFATQPDPDHLHVMVDESAIREAVAEDPVACAEQWWGKRLACLRVTLDLAEVDQIGELLTDAWERKAPRHRVEKQQPD